MRYFQELFSEKVLLTFFCNIFRKTSLAESLPNNELELQPSLLFKKGRILKSGRLEVDHIFLRTFS